MNILKRSQKKAYYIQNTAKVWNQEYYTSMGRKLQDTSDYSILLLQHSQTYSFFTPTCLWRWNRQCSETSAYKIQTPRNYQKKAYNIKNTVKVWNQESCVTLSLSPLPTYLPTYLSIYLSFSYMFSWSDDWAYGHLYPYFDKKYKLR